jgi:hypothetical protein
MSDIITDTILFTWDAQNQDVSVLNAVTTALTHAGITWTVEYEYTGSTLMWGIVRGNKAIPYPSARESWVIVGERNSMVSPHSLQAYPSEQKMKMLDRAIKLCSENTPEPYFRSPFYHTILIHFKTYLARLT